LYLSIWGCSPNNKAQESPEQLFLAEFQAIQTEFAPDKRTALFEASLQPEGKAWVLKGETDQKGAKEAVVALLQTNGINFTDSLQLLPAPELEGKHFGVVTISVANLRSQPRHAAELATQALLGTPMKVLKQLGSWFLVQTPDQYLAWADQGGFTQMDAAAFQQWQSRPKAIFQETYGALYESPTPKSATVSDLVAGNVMAIVGREGNAVKLALPDGREGFVPAAQLNPLSDWLEQLQPSPENLVSTAYTMMGIPYLWGGTSAKGADCSGFTKTIYFMNGMVIPRDASQQVHSGKLVETGSQFENLVPGDLLFFGTPATEEKAERVIHVGLWIGNQQFIHASGKVRISSVDPEHPLYDQFEVNRFLRAKRILGHLGEKEIALKSQNIFEVPAP
jgi:cell wall-associated NlpC family hydrolase